MKLYHLLFAVLLIGALAGCKSDTSSSTTADQADTESEKEKKYIITPFDRSTQYPEAKLTDMTYQGGKFDFRVTGSKYKLGAQTPDAAQKMCANSGKGQHIHLIIDTKPYAAQYVANFAHEVSDGRHNLLAFLSRSYHESIKTPDASIAQIVTVEGGSITGSEDITEPTLFYSRPKGTYVGDDAKKIMVDFYPLNVDIGKDYMVKLQVNGEVTILDKWQPYFIENLPLGQNTIGIALVYPDGSSVPGAQTAILQTITLKEDPVPSN